MGALRRTLRIALALAAAILAAAALYVGTACLLMVWPRAPEAPAAEAQAHVPAWVLSNGVHTDLVLPLQGHGMDWSGVFPAADLAAPPPADAQFIAIGWGDREFYLHTPTWADLTARRALGALAGRHTALLHVTRLRRSDLDARAFALPLTPAQYARLSTHILDALPGGVARPVPGAHYGRTDAFYEATGRYGLFFTCNQWTGQALRAADVPMPAWTPFDFNVTWQLAPLAPGS